MTNLNKINPKNSDRTLKKHGINFYLRFSESLVNEGIPKAEIIKEPLVNFAKIKRKHLTAAEKKGLGIKNKEKIKIYKLSITLFVPKELNIYDTSDMLNISDQDDNEAPYIGFDYSTEYIQEQGDFKRRAFEIGYYSKEGAILNNVFVHYFQILYAVPQGKFLTPEAIVIETHNQGVLDPEPKKTSRGTKTSAATS